MKEQYRDKTVLVTGQTGFKGAWLCLLLKELGAKVVGYALPPSTTPNLFDLADVAEGIIHIEGDIRDYAHFERTVFEHKPDIVFHLAAQPIVLDSYENPKDTFDINAGGTVNVLEALRKTGATTACVIVTTDKVYDNKEWSWGYRENDSLGGKDPYSASKSMAELAVAAYRSSFFALKGERPLLLASVRAGNIIGGGDFSQHRIIPDCMRALSQGKEIVIRNPQSARPWLYVLDALKGYLELGATLLQGDAAKGEAWNFGPLENRGITVLELAEKAIQIWGGGSWTSPSQHSAPHEMPLLRLNWDKAAHGLNWAPSCDWQKALEETVSWYRTFYEGGEMRGFCLDQVHRYLTGGQHAVYSCSA